MAATTIVYSSAPFGFERAHDVLDRRRLLADGDVDAGHVLTLLVDDRVDRHRGLAGLAVADDQLALAAADRAPSSRSTSGRSAPAGRRDWRAITPGATFSIDVRHLGVDRALAVDRRAERVDDAADQLGADRHFEDAARCT